MNGPYSKDQPRERLKYAAPACSSLAITSVKVFQAGCQIDFGKFRKPTR